MFAHSEKEKINYFHSVKVSGKDGTLVSVLLNVSNTNNRLMFWDVNENVESDSEIIGQEAEIVFNADG
jgi:hypothetical protein